MSSDAQRVTSEQFKDLLQLVHVDDLESWVEEPWSHDVGAASVHSEHLGQTRAVLTYGSVVLYGSAFVDAQRFQPDDGGMVPVLDLAGAGVTLEQAQSIVLSHMTADRAAPVDNVLLAELTVRLAQQDEDLLLAAGWDHGDVEALIRQIDADEKASLDAGPDSGFGDGSSVVCPQCSAVIPV